MMIRMLSTRLFAFIAMAFIAATALAHAEEPVELGPAIGAQIPHELVLDGAPGFEALAGENGLVLFFVRSVDWCPYCQAQVIEASSQYEAFTDLGLEVAFLSYDTPEKQAAFAARHDIGGAFISDTGSEAIKAFGLLNETHEPGSFAYGIPHPVVFILDETGMIADKLYEADYLQDARSYTDRPAIEIILDAARAASS